MADLHYWAMAGGYGFVRAYTDVGNTLLKEQGAAGYKTPEQTWVGPVSEWHAIANAAEAQQIRVAFN
jgi:hypothetical protein